MHNSPSAGERRSANSEREYELNRYHDWKIFWAEGSKVFLPADVEADLTSYSGDPHLQSADALAGFHIQASDGPAGRLDDFVLDDDSWTIRHYVADIGTYVSFEKRW